MIGGSNRAAIESAIGPSKSGRRRTGGASAAVPQRLIADGRAGAAYDTAARPAAVSRQISQSGLIALPAQGFAQPRSMQARIVRAS